MRGRADAAIPGFSYVADEMRTALPPREPVGAGQVDVDELVEALGRPDFYPHRPVGVEHRETPISWVFLAGERAYKLKKPVILPFLDYGTAQRRRSLCEEEVRLNRRLAPDVYLGVRSVVWSHGRLELRDPGDPGAVEHVVEMSRFDEGRTLAARLAAGHAGRLDIERIGRRLADFHRHAPSRPHESDEPARIQHAINDSFEVISPWAHVIGSERVHAAQRFAQAFLAARGPAIVARGRRGLVREGHGDLRAEHVLLDGDDVVIVDCVEFDRELREIDVGADLSFLVMDLARLGHSELGWDVVRAYRRAGGDPGPDAHIAFHAAARAWVRTKLACLRAGDPERSDHERSEAVEEARSTFAVGERLTWRARLPLVLCACGVPASGKSHLAAALADRSGLSVVDSDTTRKRLAGLDPAERAPRSAYDDETSRRTYAAIGSSAAALVHEQGGAIVDATFRHAADRAAFRRALGRPVPPLVFVECLAPPDVLKARARTREQQPGRVSDAGVAEVARLSADWEPLGDLAPGRHVPVRTDRLIGDAVDDVVAMLDRRLDGAAALPEPDSEE